MGMKAAFLIWGEGRGENIDLEQMLLTVESSYPETVCDERTL
jgi:hypothetical protein